MLVKLMTTAVLSTATVEQVALERKPTQSRRRYTDELSRMKARGCCQRICCIGCQ